VLAAQPALINGVPGLVWVQGGQPRVVFDFTFDSDNFVAIDLIGDAEQLGSVKLIL
jgi:RNA polymerase sigma-70 factor, ECF subfamily